MSALNSVARLSVSMTMSMSSGLYSMADEDTKEEKEENDLDNFNQNDDLSIDITKYVRRSSTSRTAMSDIEEETSAAGSSYKGGESPEEPENISGVQIVIDPGPQQELDEDQLSVHFPSDAEELLVSKSPESKHDFNSDSDIKENGFVISTDDKRCSFLRNKSPSSQSELLL